eukprot:2260463-Rhodomonas_salina.1
MRVCVSHSTGLDKCYRDSSAVQPDSTGSQVSSSSAIPTPRAAPYDLTVLAAVAPYSLTVPTVHKISTGCTHGGYRPVQADSTGAA